MKKKILAAVLTVAMTAVMIAGCTGTAMPAATAPAADGAATEAAAPAGEAKDMTFVIVPKCVHAWFDEVNKGAVKQADFLSSQMGVKVSIDYRAPSAADVAEQNSVLEQAAATHPDGIALDPVDYEGSKSVIEEIQAQGIPVILFDAPSPEGSGLTSVGNDFTEQAQIAANWLAGLIGEKGKVAVMQGFPSAPNHAERYQAHLDALAQYPNIEVVDGGIDNDNVETAQSQAAAVLAANPDLVGYLNCDACGAGVAAAIEEAGKAGQVKFVAMDNLIEILDYVKSGTITATSSTLPQMQGSYAVLMMYEAANGQEIPQKVDTGIGVIDENNIDEWIEIVSQ
ncbi:MAG: substrate-binding domain-containing protein [Lachnospiraceae bacterium]|nr:substrate-binding domain-containing protein [Lachnospiraceae bacterium]